MKIHLKILLVYLKKQIIKFVALVVTNFFIHIKHSFSSSNSPDTTGKP